MKKIFLVLTFMLLSSSYEAGAQNVTSNSTEPEAEVLEEAVNEHGVAVRDPSENMSSEAQKNELKDQVITDRKLLEDENFSYEVKPEDSDLSAYIRVNQYGEIEEYVKVDLPACDDAELLNLVKQTIEAYQDSYRAVTILGRRKQNLMLKKLKDFEEISPYNITSKDDVFLANNIIKLKINNAVRGEDIRVCKGPDVLGGANMYIIIYNVGTLITGKIINFAEYGTAGSNMEFIYN